MLMSNPGANNSIFVASIFEFDFCLGQFCIVYYVMAGLDIRVRCVCVLFFFVLSGVKLGRSISLHWNGGAHFDLCRGLATGLIFV